MNKSSGENKAQVIWLAFTIVAITMIWGFSLTPAVESASESNFVMDTLNGIYKFLHLPFTATVTGTRKTAHFVEYMTLGVLTSGTLYKSKARIWLRGIFAWLSCVVVATIDEIIQLFVEGRTGRFTDVLLDSAGALTGCVIFFVIVLLLWRKHSSGGNTSQHSSQ